MTTLPASAPTLVDPFTAAAAAPVPTLDAAVTSSTGPTVPHTLGSTPRYQLNLGALSPPVSPKSRGAPVLPLSPATTRKQLATIDAALTQAQAPMGWFPPSPAQRITDLAAVREHDEAGPTIGAAVPQDEPQETTVPLAGPTMSEATSETRGESTGVVADGGAGGERHPLLAAAGTPASHPPQASVCSPEKNDRDGPGIIPDSHASPADHKTHSAVTDGADSSIAPRAASGIHRTTRPPTLPLHETRYTSWTDRAPIIPFTRPPGSAGIANLTLLGGSLLTPTSAAASASPAHRSFEVVPPASPVTSTTSHRGGGDDKGDLYARRGSTDTFGGARSRGSIIVIPTTTATGSLTPLDPLQQNQCGSVTTAASPDMVVASPFAISAGSPPSATHEQPESPSAIMQHLLDARERNKLAILPASPPSRPASSFTDSVPEERLPHGEGDGIARDLVQLDLETPTTPSGGYWNNRHTAMFDLDEDQVNIVTRLRNRSGSEAERVLEEYVLHRQPKLTPSLCEDDRSSKLSTEIIPDTSPEPPGIAHMGAHPGVYRTMSNESGGSSGSADSATVGLLPPESAAESSSSRSSGRSSGKRQRKFAPTVDPMFSLPSPPSLSSTHFTVSPAPATPLARLMPSAIASKVDLPADQKAVLIKRTRKLEKVLGAPLPEQTVERFVVEPTISPTTVATKIAQASWPKGNPTMPEWMRDDCIPQRASPLISAQHVMAPYEKPAGTSTRSRLARALLGDPAPAPPRDLRVYVSRECYVAETRDRELRQPSQIHLESILEPRVRVRGVSTAPNMVASQDFPPSVVQNTEESGRRVRRSQLNKRILGNPVNPSDLHSPSTSDEALPSPPSSTHLSALPNLARTLSNTSLVVAERTRDRWANKFKRGSSHGPTHTNGHDHGHRRGVSPAPSVVTTVDCSDEGATLSSEALTASQRRLVRKRATKLGKLFGDAPPANLFLPAADSAESVNDTAALAPTTSQSPGSNAGVGGLAAFPVPLVRSPAYQSYASSLNSLIFMAEHDPARLASIFDELGSDRDCQKTYSLLRQHPESPAGIKAHAQLPARAQPPTSPRLDSHLSVSTRGSRRASAPPASLIFSPPNDPFRSPTPAPMPMYARQHPLLAHTPTLRLNISTPTPVSNAASLPSPTGIGASPPNVSALAMRLKRTSRLAHFFGESSSTLADLPCPPSLVMEDDEREWDDCDRHVRSGSGSAAFCHAPYRRGIDRSDDGATLPRSAATASCSEFSSSSAVVLPPRLPIEPIVHNGNGAGSEPAFHSLPPPPPPRRRRPAPAPPSPTASSSERASSTTPTPIPTASLTLAPSPSAAAKSSTSALSAPVPAPSVLTHMPGRRPSSITIVGPPTGKLPVVVTAGTDTEDLESPGASGSPSPGASPLLAARSMGRRATLDAVLGELWENVQSGVRRGSVGSHEAAALSDMMGVLRQKRQGEAWAEVRECGNKNRRSA